MPSNLPRSGGLALLVIVAALLALGSLFGSLDDDPALKTAAPAGGPRRSAPAETVELDAMPAAVADAPAPAISVTPAGEAAPAPRRLVKADEATPAEPTEPGGASAASATMWGVAGPPPTLTPGEAETGLSGRVVDSLGAPVAGAKVSIIEQPKSAGAFRILSSGLGGPHEGALTAGSATSGEDGRYEVLGLAPTARYTISAEGEGFVKARAMAPTLSSGRVVNAGDIRLARPGRISGIVLDGSGRPVAGAKVMLQSSDALPPIGFEGFEDEPEPSEDGTVVARRTVGAVFVAGSTGGGGLKALSMGGEVRRSDEQGRFAFEDLEPDTYTLRAARQGWRNGLLSGIAVTEGKHASGLELRLGAPSNLSVTVLNEAGEPLAEAEVQLEVRVKTPDGQASFSMTAGEPKRTDSAGIARFEAVTHPAVTVTAAAKGYIKASTEARFEGQPEVAATLTLSPGATVRGRVLGPDGGPQRAMVLVQFDDASDSASPPMPVRSDERGAFVLPALPPGPFTVRAMPEAPGLRKVERSFTLAEGQDELDLGDLTLGSLRELEVLVLDPEGEPVAGAAVRIDGQGFRMIRRESKREDEDGEEEEVDVTVAIGGLIENVTSDEGLVTLAEVEPGQLRLEVTKAGFATTRVEGIEVPETGAVPRATVRLSLGARIEGELFDASGAPAAGATVSLLRRGWSGSVAQATTDADGRFRFDAVAAGTYVLSPIPNAIWRDDAAEEAFELRDGELITRSLRQTGD